MKFDDFIEVVSLVMEKNIASDQLVKVEEVYKVNKLLHSISIVPRGIIEENMIYPVAYLEKYYDNFQRGKSIQGIVADIIADLTQYRDASNLELPQITNYEMVKNMIRLQIINMNKNEKLLSSIPYKEILDLAIISYIDLKTDSGLGRVVINTELLKVWNKKADEVFEIGRKNFIEKGLLLKPIEEIIVDQFIQNMDNTEMDQSVPELVDMLSSDSKMKMFVIGTKDLYYGAYSLTVTELLVKAASLLHTYKVYILPSSVHEILIVDATDLEVAELKNMVGMVNIAEVSEDDYLSDSVYEFNTKTNLLSIA